MKTSTSTTEGTEVKFKHAETLVELQEHLSEAEIVKLTNDYLNRHHFLPEMRTALRNEVTAKTDEGKARQAGANVALMERIEAGEEFNLYDFAPERRGESKGGAKVKAAVNAVKEAIVAKLVASGMSEEAARAIADAV